jgi:hypothetical protein
MRAVLAGDYGGGLYRRRKVIVEPVFAHTKHNRRIDRFQLNLVDQHRSAQPRGQRLEWPGRPA